ncbi:hypothetical protein DBR43_03820 [Pedobacter sp. KBW06]|nr:hypothetical protein DBR43_03820 [Pedobacter sp. KBW06]
MKNTIKKTALKTADFLGTFQPKLKRSRAKPRTRIKRLLRQALTFQDQKIMEEIYRKFSV